ncbi:tetrapyrrole methylase family protein/MazG family protein [Bacillus pakistanensis]|uniref:Tetrapyrrole methylase family protein/MazG family protein n=1 Tax=Rossellomorea pakistanensis TaxID=992288 RepID=A0ABS2NK35_9BACI|nr:nucleoside triphosphate pyrophosphohydrolase [Bacillus pakistanensis]MBM7588194.1 tetrapyrrole methylase family protein/MazG family protein [Bacillus pakistanensis]
MSHKITVVGLGAGDLLQLPLGVYRELKSTQNLYLRTKEHPVVEDLEKESIHYQSFDSIYEKHDQFQKVYEEIVAILIKESQKSDLVYAVPGHPLVAEQTVQLLIDEASKQTIQLEIGGGQSFIDALFTSVKADPIEGFQLLDGTQLQLEDIKMTQHLIIGQVYDAFIASEVKLTLMELYPYDYKVKIVTAAGSQNEMVKEVSLYELDREASLSNLTSVYVPPVNEMEARYKEFTTLKSIISTLRGPGGCPWDQKQTHHTLKKYLIEETYELLEAIEEDDIDHIIEELGDVLLQIMLHAQIGEDEGMFTIRDVIEKVSEKMVRRHPHVFGTTEVEDADEVVSNWEQIKQEEKSGDGKNENILKAIAKGYPALIQAYEYQKKAAKVGFDWKDPSGAWQKVWEELKEFEEEISNDNRHKQLSEFGDLLFALVNLSRFYSIHPEEALASANQKFYRRFTYVQERVMEIGKKIEDFSLEDLDAYWNEAKDKGL